jgi:photosystem II stability/assembly factor-like uncharacterized protein
VAACGVFAPDAPEPTWASLGLDDQEVTALAETPWGLYAGTTSSGVFRYEATTQTWRENGLAEVGVINELLYVAADPPRLLAAVAPRRGATVEAVVFASKDSETWVPSDGGYAAAVGQRAAGSSLAPHPSDPRGVVGGLSGTVIQSPDGGESWRFSFGDTVSHGDIPSIWLESNGTVWFVANLADDTRSLFYSTDGGATWHGATVYGTDRGDRPLILNDGFVSGNGRLWLAGTQARMPTDPPHPTIVVASTDTGETLEHALLSQRTLAQAGPKRMGASGALAFIAARDTLYAVSQQAGNVLAVFRLRPGKTMWDVIDVEPGIAGGLSAALDAQGRLLIGTAGAGVWRMEW